MFCPNCGNKISEGVSFCSNCGWKNIVINDNQKNDNNKNSNNLKVDLNSKINSLGSFLYEKRIVAVPLAVLVLIIIIVLFVVSLGKNSDVIKKDSRGSYYLDKNGDKVVSDWINKDGSWYYADESGYLVNNQWLNISYSYYYFDNECKMLSNQWIKDDDGHDYFVDYNGKRLMKCYTPDGFYVDKYGRYVPNFDFTIYNLITKYKEVKQDTKKTVIERGSFGYGTEVVDYEHTCKFDDNFNLYENLVKSRTVDYYGRQSIWRKLNIYYIDGKIDEYIYSDNGYIDYSCYKNGEEITTNKTLYEEYREISKMYSDMYDNYDKLLKLISSK